MLPPPPPFEEIECVGVCTLCSDGNDELEDEGEMTGVDPIVTLSRAAAEEDVDVEAAVVAG